MIDKTSTSMQGNITNIERDIIRDLIRALTELSADKNSVKIKTLKAKYGL